MYERTGVCPFIDKCEYYIKIQKIERNVNHNRREIVSKMQNIVKHDEAEFKDIQRRSENLNRARKRCYENHGHCLRFWNLQKKEQDKIFDYTMQTNLVVNK